MTAEDTIWKRCGTCKKPIAFASGYYACSVSTCNRRGTSFVFCSVGCWDGHVPVMRHRDDVGAVEAIAPTAAEWQGASSTDQDAARAPRRVTVASPPAGEVSSRARPGGGAAGPRDVLVVVSKLKLYVRATADLNTSDDVVEELSAQLRDLCDAAVERARAAGRKTVMARDFRRI